MQHYCVRKHVHSLLQRLNQKHLDLIRVVSVTVAQRQTEVMQMKKCFVYPAGL